MIFSLSHSHFRRLEELVGQYVLSRRCIIYYGYVPLNDVGVRHEQPVRVGGSSRESKLIPPK
jgi:hypothetical protein